MSERDGSGARGVGGGIGPGPAGSGPPLPHTAAPSTSSGAFSTGIEWIFGLDDRLMTWSNDLKLYRIRPETNPLQQSIDGIASETWNMNRVQLSQDSVAELECQVPDPPHYIRCAQVFPGLVQGSDVRFAVGQASGKVTLMSFDEVNREANHTHTHVIQEFGPKVQGRICNDLAWNAKRPNLLAAGYEKSRHDAGVLVFDTNAGLSGYQSTYPATPSVHLGSPLGIVGKMTSGESLPNATAVTEIGPGDTCHSISWFREQPDLLIFGINSKNLKVHDLRMSGTVKAAMINYTRLVYGVCVDPWLDYRVASHHENQVAIWDTRNFERPIVTLQQVQKIAKLSWSPTRSGLLASVVEGGKNIRLHDIQSWAVMTEDGDPAVIEREVKCSNLQNTENQALPMEVAQQSISTNPEHDTISGFAWHPKQESVLVCVMNSGRLAKCAVPERMTPAWSSSHALVWPNTGTLRMFDIGSPLYHHVTDISVQIRERAELNIFNNDMTVSSLQSYVDHSTIEAWKWVEKCRLLMQDLSFKNQFPGSITVPGVRSALGLDRHSSSPSPVGSSVVSSLNSDITYSQWNSAHGYLPGSRNEHMMDPDGWHGERLKKIYRGAARERTLKICQWGSDDQELRKFLKLLEDKGGYSRAATIAIFCLQIRLATQILQRGGEKHDRELSVVAMALSGFNEERSGALWREMVAATAKNMTDPYLRAMFTFLLAISNPGPSQNHSGTSLEDVLDEDILTSDKVGYSCLHLPDAKLIQFVNDSWHRILENGDLSGFYLCGGSSHESVALLQRVVDLQGDVQLASWMAVKTLTVELARSDAPQQWINSYKYILDSWRLFKARAEIDNAISFAGIASNAEFQIYIACSYCNASICRSEHQIMKHLTVTPPGPTRPEQQRPRPGPQGPKEPPAATLQTLARYNSATTACSQGNIRAEMCPSCRKPLPRCAVCFINMGTLSGLIRSKNSGKPPTPGGQILNQQRNLANKKKLTTFDNFFTWCQNCHHGGHARHIIDWFKEHVRCPAFKCGCNCAALDPGTKLAKLSFKNDDRAGGLQSLSLPNSPKDIALAGGQPFS